MFSHALAKPLTRIILQSAILGSLLLAGCSSGPTPISSEAIANIDSAYANLADQHLFSGFVLIAQGEEILMSKGYGMANVEGGIPVTSSTRFNTGSIILPFSATAVMILQAEGKLDLDDPVCEYLPPCEPAIQPVLIRHLLNRTSGLPGGHYVPGDPGRWIDPGTVVPGEVFYGEEEYEYVRYLIERASGESFESFLEKAIFEPLNMANTGFISGGETDLAIGYSRYGEEVAPITPPQSMMRAFIYSSADDLLTWIGALHSGQLIPQSALEEMFAPGIHVSGEGEESVSYGLGWWLAKRNGHAASAHQGMAGGLLCNIERFGDDDTTVIVLTNLRREMADIFLAGGMLFPAP
jgi:CubicO group peptidase (beta-lactamase class C family)